MTDAARRAVPVAMVGGLAMLVLVHAGTLARITPLGTVGTPPLVDRPAGFTLGIVALVVAAGAVGRSDRSTEAVALVGGAWLLWSLCRQERAAPWLVAVACAAGVLAVAGAAALVRSAVPGVLAVLAGGLHVVGYQPLADPGCSLVCTRVAAPLADRLGAREALGLALAVEAFAVAAVAFAALSAHRLPRTTRGVAVMIAVLALVADALPWWRWGHPGASSPDQWARAAVVALVVVLVGAATLDHRRTRRQLDVLVRGIGGTGPIPGLGPVHFAVPGSTTWVDGDGAVVPPELATGGTLFTDPTGAAAIRLGHARDPAADAAITPALRLALDSARLRVVAGVRIADLRASQAQIVAEADAERHRIERDLHDGIQQHLVGTVLLLSALEPSPRLEEVRTQVRAALAAVRDLSRRTLLGVLTRDGLQAAVEDLTDAAQVPLVGSVDGAVLSRSVERAAHDLVVAGLALGADRVRLRSGADRFAVVVEGLRGVPDPGVLAAVSDRIGASGGTLRHDADQWEGAWPCES